MNSYEFLVNFFSAPDTKWRESSMNTFFVNGINDSRIIYKLEESIKSDNLDIVENSLKILFGLSYYKDEEIYKISEEIYKVASNSEHFGIIMKSVEIFDRLLLKNKEIKTKRDNLYKLITPKFAKNEPTDIYKWVQCEYFLKFKLGDEKYKYILEEICSIFEYNSKKATKKLFYYMSKLGYVKNKKYQDDLPSSFKNNHYNSYRYKNKIHYFSHHALQKLTYWCVQNMKTTTSEWRTFLEDKKDFDSFFSQFNIEEKPKFIRCNSISLNTNTEKWLNSNIEKEDVFELLNIGNNWVALFENTDIRYNDRHFNRIVNTCFVNNNLKEKLILKDILTCSYSCRNCYVDEVPIIAEENNKLSLDNYNRFNLTPDKLLPSFGTINGDFENYDYKFPSPDIVKFFNLTQKNGRLEYYKGKELVIKCINWVNGYFYNIYNRGEDRLEQAEHGSLLIIKNKYLKTYLKQNNFSLLVVGDVHKYKIDAMKGKWDYKEENMRRKRFTEVLRTI